MIGRLNGMLLEKNAPSLLLDVNGVGYEVEAPMTTFYKLPNVGEKITLHIHCVIREDAQNLYGFIDMGDRALFRHLIKVNGVGPKLALTILSGIEVDAFVKAVKAQDVIGLTRLPGVGKKTAERLMIEMRDKLSPWDNVEVGGVVQPIQHCALDDALSALIALGYKSQDATRVIRSFETDGLTSENIIRQALKKMMPT
jgi:Holliday junction DNA helicase RuvA